MRTTDATTVTLPSDVRSVGRARRHLRGVLSGSAAEPALDAAELAVSELVTNAVVHAGTEVQVRVRTRGPALRVEVADGSPHRPVRREFAVTAGTGRGLHLVEESVDRWGVSEEPDGKAVWFEIGEPDGERGDGGRHRPDAATVEVVLHHVPLLMHAAWQEHAASLLREQLLATLEEDPDALDHHAQASEALSVLAEQLPVPDLPEDPHGLLSDAIEPRVSAEEVVLRVPSAAVGHFAVLNALLQRAVHAASVGRFLGPPTQPEIGEMRRWLCTEVVEQAADRRPPVPWVARADVRPAPVGDQETQGLRRLLAVSDEPLLATDEASVIVGVSRPVLDLLGYAEEGDLVGRRVIAVVPQRYHQAHIAGTTMHATHGRDRLIGIPVTVPALRADGSEVPVRMTVDVRRLGRGRRAFVARFELPA